MFPGTTKLFLGTFWLLGTTPPFLGTLERFLGMPKIKVVPETPYRGLLVHFTHSAIRSCTKRAVPKIGDVQRTLSGIGSKSTGTTRRRAHKLGVREKMLQQRGGSTESFIGKRRRSFRRG
jgi:hypothetical protein